MTREKKLQIHFTLRFPQVRRIGLEFIYALNRIKYNTHTRVEIEFRLNKNCKLQVGIITFGVCEL